MKKLSPTTAFVLKALVPYTRPNMLLSFSPNLFFNELEKHSRYKRSTLQTAYYRSIKQGLLEIDQKRSIFITSQGRRMLQMSQPKKLKSGKKLLVSYDIPENLRTKRRYMRTLLRELEFKQIQQSVWISSYNHADYLKQECVDNDLNEFVCIFESKTLL